jgi:motility quorum-sensing regulator/GCU-specific mRNA interferase toxin
MEKSTPHNRLGEIKQLVSEGRVRHTKVAALGANALGFRTEDIARVVLSLERKDFYKSMTCYGDHTVWQDVYHAGTLRGPVYLKLSVVDDVLVVSFKEL